MKSVNRTDASSARMDTTWMKEDVIRAVQQFLAA